ncbi:hypothetical protein NQZ79_g675 [Umbelopsis isabellina]|nr:hypothetical protein NQZ79_g675 [Umbelopsis isabellina]
MLTKIFIATFLLAFQQQNVAAAATQSDVSNYQPNIAGEVVVLGGANFTQEVQDHPERSWFIKFYAPWCGHCKTLAPIWVELANTLKGKTNIAEVDCTLDEDICRDYGVTGFPTLKYISKNSAVEFRGARDHSTLLEFTEKASKSPVTYVDNAELTARLPEQEVSLIYIYNKDQPETANHDTIESVGHALLNDAVTYVTSDLEAVNKFGLQGKTLPVLVLYKNGRTLVYPGQGFSNTKEDRKDILRWIEDRKYPLYFEMGPANSNEVLRGKKFVVLSFFNPSRELEKQTDLLKATAEAYVESQEEDNGQVLFVWLDGIKHARYIYNVYGFGGNDLPAAVITDPKVTNHNYFAETIDGKRLNLANPQAMVKAIADAQAGLLPTKSTIPRAQKIAVYINKAINKARQYWYISIPAFVAITYMALKPLFAFFASMDSTNKEDKKE